MASPVLHCQWFWINSADWVSKKTNIEIIDFWLIHFGFALDSWNIHLLATDLYLLFGHGWIQISPVKIFLSLRLLQDVFKTFVQDMSSIHLQDMSSRRLEDRSSRRLQDVFARRLQDVLRCDCYAEDVLKTSSRHVFKTSSRHLEDQ